MSTVVQLEAFELPIKGTHIRWFLAPNEPITYPPGFQEQCFIESPPFQRKILLTSHQVSEAWYLVDTWDAIVNPSTQSDWSIILTLVLNQPHSCMVCITPGVRIPPALFQKCKQAGAKGPTIVVFQHLTFPIPQAPVVFDTTFFPPSVVLEEGCHDSAKQVLQQLLPSDSFRTFCLKDAVKDLKGAGATLVCSSVESSVQTIYWYYASPTKLQKTSLLASVVQTLLARQ